VHTDPNSKREPQKARIFSRSAALKTRGKRWAFGPGNESRKKTKEVLAANWFLMQTGL
jgi:hypothetical protein